MQIAGLGGVLVGGVDEGDVELLGMVSGREPHVLDLRRYGDVSAGCRGDAAHNLLVPRREGASRRSQSCGESAAAAELGRHG